jgi:hypothetical protein
MTAKFWITAAIVALLAFWGWAGHRDAGQLQIRLDTANVELGKVRGERDSASTAARLCSDSVSELKQAADARAVAAEPARQQATQRAVQHNQRADAILAAPPAVIDDDAASARIRIDEWLRARGQ